MTVVKEVPKKEGPRFLNDYEELQEMKSQLAKAKNDISLGMLATMIENMTDLIEGSLERKVDFYDSGLGKTIAESLNKVSDAFKVLTPQKIDLSPLKAIVESTETLTEANQKISVLIKEISNQNKELLTAFNGAIGKMGTPQEVQDMSRYDEMLSQSMRMIAKTNELLSKSQAVVDYGDKLTAIAASLSRPKAWEFVVNRENAVIKTITATAK